MSPRTPSSSSSWCGARGGDIIDLDRYMRGNVRPSRTLSNDSKPCDRLVVDGGAVSHKLRSIRNGSRESLASRIPDARPKQFSHDSGVSDGSYQRPRRIHRAHRRSNFQDNTKYRDNEIPSAKTPSGRVISSSSLRAFRTSCQQALIEQQQQIARVAQLCERLTERAEKTERSEKTVQNVQLEHNKCKEKVLREISEDTSEISSSSRSTKESKDERRKDKHRNEEFKTYKIIMNKLDELNRIFKMQPPRPALLPPPSSASVSVCDKVVATEPLRNIIVNRVMTPTVQTFRRDTSVYKQAPSVGSNAHSSRNSRVTSTRAVTRVFSVDIAPRGLHATHPNIVTESIVNCDSKSNKSQHSAGDPRCGFDLEDPVHLYTQAKRLQALTASTRRAHSVCTRDEHARSERSRGEHARSDRSPSVCALCRAYCRYLRQCVLGPLLARTHDCKYS